MYVSQEMDEKVFDQICNVAALPGIVKGSFAMPDAHWGYGFPIGGVAAFDPDHDGVSERTAAGTHAQDRRKGDLLIRL